MRKWVARNLERGVRPNLRKEQFSHAWVRAIASVAGFSVSQPSVDDDSIDIAFAENSLGGTHRAPRIEAQLKCTSEAVVKNDSMQFQLKIKNYNDLRSDAVMVPRILIVIRVPENLDESLRQSHDELVLKYCGHWLSLRGFAPSENDTGVTVQVPLMNKFDVRILQNMMRSVAESGKIIC